jgi:phytanoyl-CoA hydroxylase
MLAQAASALTTEQVHHYQTHGYVAGPRVLSDEQAEALSDEVLRVIARRDDPAARQPVMISNISAGDREVWQIVNIWQASDLFSRLAHDPNIVEASARLTGGRELYMWHDQIQYKPAMTGGANWWHQDSIYWPVHLVKDAQITAWIALDDADVENGCMWMVPGSHQWGNQTEYLHARRQELGLRRFHDLACDHQGRAVKPVACPVRRGHVHFHHPLTWHGSPANESGRPRRAIALHYMDERVTFDSHGNHPMKPYIHAAHGEPVRGPAFPRVWPHA